MATYIFITSICLAAIVFGLVLFQPNLNNGGSIKEKNTRNRDKGQLASKYRGVYVISD